MRSVDKQSNKARLKQCSYYFLVVTRCQHPCQSRLYLTASQGPFGIASCSLLEVGVFPTLVDSLAVEVMSDEVLLGFVVEKTS